MRRHLRYLIVASLSVLALPAQAFNIYPLFRDTPAERFNDRDIDLFLEAKGKALAGQPVGEPVRWENPATSASGSITVIEEFEAGGRPCKRLRIENRANGQTGTGLWQYCREPDGRWELSSIR
jgi:surface antigen